MKASAFVNELLEKYCDSEGLPRLLTAHSECVARKALDVAREAGFEDKIDRQFVYDAAMLHDIGVCRCDAPGIHCHGTLPYICHGIAGAEILKEEGLDERYQRICARHTGTGITAEDIRRQHLPLPPGDYTPQTLEEKLICYADKFFSKSGDPRKEKSLDKVEASMARHGAESLARFHQLHELMRKKDC